MKPKEVECPECGSLFGEDKELLTLHLETGNCKAKKRKRAGVILEPPPGWQPLRTIRTAVAATPEERMQRAAANFLDIWEERTIPPVEPPPWVTHPHQIVDDTPAQAAPPPQPPVANELTEEAVRTILGDNNPW